MMRHLAMIVAALALALALGAHADVLGPEWVENDNGGGDAGSTPGDAQTTTGEGVLGRIRGKLTGLEVLPGTGEPDLEDVYIICISDPEAFMATTELYGGYSQFDSRLYLFDLPGLGLLGNDIPPNCPPAGDGPLCEGATLGNMSTDGTGVVIDQTGLYLLAITVSPREPISKSGPIFMFDEPGEVSGPDGPGGGNPLVGWIVDGCPGTGGCFVPNGTPGCEDEACCEIVCAVDPFCCDVEWDSICADEALELCDGVAVGACCLEGSCQILTADECASASGSYLGDFTTCEGDPCAGTCPGTGSCFEPNKTPGCEDETCCEIVCAADPFCCEVAWDSICVDGALELCDGKDVVGACCVEEICLVVPPKECAALAGIYQGDFTTCGPDTCAPADACPAPGSCFVPHDTPGCDNEACCEIVCSSDSFCCLVEWDGLCVELANEICTVNEAETATTIESAVGGEAGNYLIILEGVCFATAVPMGACETPDGCQDTTEYDCRAVGGKFLGNGTTCGEDCNANGIPDDDETAPENDPSDVMPADDPADADLVCTDIFYEGDTFSATNDTNIFCDLIYGGAHDVWFRYRPKAGGTAVAKVCEFDFGWIDGEPARAMVSVHSGIPGSQSNLIACNFASAVGTNCGAVFNAVAGETYWIRVAGEGASVGTFSLEVKGPACLLNVNDINENGVPDDCECLADVDGNGVVDGYDFLLVQEALGSACEGCPEDVNSDGVVDETDLTLVLLATGPCPEVP